MAVDQRPFGNVIDINGTEVNVEDKRLAELAGQTPKSSSQISTSSQYVPLQDTDGNIVKISPASFQEAVRNTLASLLVNNDKGTSFSQVPVIGSGDFGSASLANLASVLGVEMVYKKVEYYSTKETIELGGYGLYILTDCANTGGTTLFTYSYQANSVNIISDPSGNVSSGHYSITKSSTGTVCVVTNNNTKKATTLIRIGGSQ